MKRPRRNDSVVDIPSDVMWVWGMQLVKYVGYETYQKIQEIIAKYPEYFPEETSYNNNFSRIPQENHDAFEEFIGALSYDVPYPEIRGLVKYCRLSQGIGSKEDLEKFKANEDTWNEAITKRKELIKIAYNKYYKPYLGSEYLENFINR